MRQFNISLMQHVSPQHVRMFAETLFEVFECSPPWSEICAHWFGPDGCGIGTTDDQDTALGYLTEMNRRGARFFVAEVKEAEHQVAGFSVARIVESPEIGEELGLFDSRITFEFRGFLGSGGRLLQCNFGGIRPEYRGRRKLDIPADEPDIWDELIDERLRFGIDQGCTAFLVRTEHTLTPVIRAYERRDFRPAGVFEVEQFASTHTRTHLIRGPNQWFH